MAGPPTAPLRIDTAVTSSLRPDRVGPIGDADQETGPAEAGPTDGTTARSVDLVLSFEQPYPVDARPRAASAVQAAAEDEDLARWNLGGSGDPAYPSSQASFHPGTRVVVDTTLGTHLSAVHRARKPSASHPAPRGRASERIQAQARSKGYWPFRLCFEAGQRERKGLGGETRIAFTIGTRGSVVSARLLGSELKNQPTAACLLSELRRIQFGPQAARRMDALASIRIWPGDAELPPLSERVGQAVDTSNGFDPDTVRSRVLSNQSKFDLCLSEARKADARLWGRLAFSVVLEVDGSVHQVSEVESRFPNAGAARCAAAALSSLIFPSVNGKPFCFVLAMRLAPPNLEAAPDHPLPAEPVDSGAIPIDYSDGSAGTGG